MTSVFGNKGLATPIMDQKNELLRKLVYRTLGKTGMRVPVIGMGILNSGSPALMNTALDAGITHFDSTALGRVDYNNNVFLIIRDLTPGMYGHYVPAKRGQEYWLFHRYPDMAKCGFA